MTTAAPASPPVSRKSQALSILGILGGIITVVGGSLGIWTNYVRFDQDLQLAPSNFNVMTLTLPLELEFVVTNSGSRPAVLVSAYLTFFEKDLKPPAAAPPGALTGATVIIQGWPEEQAKANGLPLTLQRDQTVVIKLKVPPPVDDHHSHPLMIVTRATSTAASSTVEAAEFVSYVSGLDTKNDRYTRVGEIKPFILQLLTKSSIHDRSLPNAIPERWPIR